MLSMCQRLEHRMAALVKTEAIFFQAKWSALATRSAYETQSADGTTEETQFSGEREDIIERFWTADNVRF